jgi:hypothetical protein
MENNQSTLDQLKKFDASAEYNHKLIERVSVSVRADRDLATADKLSRKLVDEGWELQTTVGHAYADDVLIVTFTLERDAPDDSEE